MGNRGRVGEKPLDQLLTKEQLEFPEFASAVLRGLGKAVISEPDMFVLALSAILPKRLGAAFAIWFMARRADQYLSVLDSKLTLLSRVIAESNQRGDDDRI
jgi:hypothetical protein